MTIISNTSTINISPITTTTTTQPPTDDYHPSGYNLVWSDEFNGTLLDTNKWEKWFGSYTIENGSMWLKGTQTSSVLIRSKYGFKYGYLAINAKLALGRGFVSQLWTNMPGPTLMGKYPEIDLNEMGGQNPRYFQTNVHRDSSTQWMQIIRDIGFDLTTNYHVHSIEWTSTYVKFFIDGVLKHTVSAYSPNQTQNVILSLCVGSSCAGGVSPDDNTKYPSKMYVDYVRIYQK